MKLLHNLFSNNEAWARAAIAGDPQFFNRLSSQQRPPFYWIGCSDSRVPANEIVGLPPGELFVHRNVANLIVHKDPNSMAALQYAIDLGVDHVMIVGHYGCAGIRAAMNPERMPDPVGGWLDPVRRIYESRREQFSAIPDEQAQWDLLCELNVVEQVGVACELPCIRDGWARGRKLAVHGWIYNMRDGRLRDLNVTVSPELGNTTGGPGSPGAA